MDSETAQLEIKKHDGRMMMLVINSVKEKHKPWTEWKKGKNKKFQQLKEKARRAGYPAKCEAETENISKWYGDGWQNYDVFKIAKNMVKINQNIIGNQCIRNNDGVLAVRDEDEKVTWKSNHKKLLNFQAPIPQNGQTQSNNLSAICWQIVWVCLVVLW